MPSDLRGNFFTILFKNCSFSLVFKRGKGEYGLVILREVLGLGQVAKTIDNVLWWFNE